jgi:hypothetical protein
MKKELKQKIIKILPFAIIICSFKNLPATPQQNLIVFDPVYRYIVKKLGPTYTGR